jgi:uncharacterized protein with ParB-like and HNH nuclease domain
MASESKIYEPQSKSIYSLFGDTGSYYYVPSYQRPYKWESEQIEQLWDDIDDAMRANIQSYFMGPVILVKAHSGLEVVDGQQRLTTLTILFCIIRDFYKDRLSDSSLVKKIGNAIRSLDEDKPRLRFKTKLEHENQFEHEIANGVTIPNNLTNEQRGKDKFINAAYIFKRNLENAEKEKGIEYIENLINYLMENVEVITIVCSKREYAIRLFQIINTRGLDLTNADLIRSELLEKLVDEERIKVFDSTWHELETILNRVDVFKEGEDPINELLTYYEYYLLAKNPEGSLYKELKASFDNKEPLDVIYELKKFAEAFYEVISEDNKIIYGLQYLPNQVFWRAILATAKYNGYNKYDELCESIRRLYYIYWIAGHTTSKVKQISFDMIRWIKETKNITEINEKIMNKFREDRVIPQLKEALDNEAYSKKWLKPLLILIEYEQTDDSHPVFLKLNKKLNVDHILPEGWKNYPEWTNIWQEGEAKAHLNNIENLTLLSESKNKSQQDAPFEEKKKIYMGNDKRGTTAFAISKLVAEKHEWTVKEAIERKEWIYRQVMKIFDINFNELVSAIKTIKEEPDFVELQKEGHGFIDSHKAEKLVLEKLLSANKPMKRIEIVKGIYEDIKDKLTDYDKEPTESGRIRWEGFVGWAISNLGKVGHITNLDGENKWVVTDKGREVLRTSIS